ncbi:MAG: 16S rRNA (guanine(527)-N(7))-methyltransferase RsmG [Bacteroidetes bacterium HGW-Bacteroidetes-21]|jgi:16S rRNA (guanine527-N7)-methyltransferase|nr:MAG: 16S rRNA (guanine(527)-N(7))-methyltransferase RsmG [Bacteroidetes bacterium HGW-Bacteroidetes-21]
MDIIKKYFPDLTPQQEQQLEKLKPLYLDWNSKINVISRNDIENLYERHVLHSLSILKFFRFDPKTTFLDVGTGGGFPGIPLAIMLPECHFTLIDSIGKKIKVVNEVATAIGLSNLNAKHENVKNITKKYNYVVSRAVTTLPEFYQLAGKNILPSLSGKTPNGIIYLKGGDLSSETQAFSDRCEIFDISMIFKEAFFETKKIVFVME